MRNVFADFRYVARSLAKSPGFSAVAVLTLALGIGPNAAIFSVVNEVLLRPLPYEEPNSLVSIWGELPKRDVYDFPASPVAVERYRREATSFEDFGGGLTFNQPLSTTSSESDQVSTAVVTWNLPEMLGLQLRLGRLFVPEDAVFNPDEVPEEAAFPQTVFNPPSVAVLSHGLWQRQFGGDPGVLGRVVELGGNPVEIVGVMARGTRLLMPPEANIDSRPDIWVPARVDLANAPLTNVIFTPIGRLKSDVSIRQAQEEMNRITSRMRSEVPIFEAAGFRNRLEPLHRDITDNSRAAVLMLFGAVTLVLLVACANVAGLLLVRGQGRARETAIRTAIGCSRARLFGLKLTEAGLLALGGAALGIGLAYACLAILPSMVPADLPRLDAVGLNPSVLLFTVGVTLLVTFLSGLYPALRTTSTNLSENLKTRSGGGSPTSRRGFRGAMVIGEVALSFVLLVAAGLMIRSFVALQQADPGYEPRGVLTFFLNFPPDEFPVPESSQPFKREFQRRLSALPGVTSVGGVFPLPLTGVELGSRYAPDEATFLSDNVDQASYRAVIPGYFESMQTDLLRGRPINRSDQDNARAVAVVDDLLAERTWPGEDPIGKPLFIRLATPDPVRVEVIGVVEHQRQSSLHEDGRPTVFMPETFAAGITGGGMFWTVRSELEPLSLAGPIRDLVATMNPNVQITNLTPMTEHVNAAMGETRFALAMIGAFAAIALVLAAVGLYGLLSYLVRQQTPEIGIRMSFGARPADVFRQVVGRGMALVGIGLGLGVSAALLASRTMRSLLVEVTPMDPATLTACALVFALVALAACFLPARRATLVHPAVALRAE